LTWPRHGIDIACIAISYRSSGNTPHLPNMGNAASVEDPGRTHRASVKKLSKARAAQNDTSLLSPGGHAPPRRRSWTPSLHNDNSPAPSPMFPLSEQPLENQTVYEMEQAKPKLSRSRSITHTAAALFRSKSTLAPQRTSRRRDSLRAPVPDLNARLSRTHSMLVGAEEDIFSQQYGAAYVCPR
jgi:hypothetical protein